jgi:hypothetical protein
MILVNACTDRTDVTACQIPHKHKTQTQSWEESGWEMSTAGGARRGGALAPPAEPLAAVLQEEEQQPEQLSTAAGAPPPAARQLRRRRRRSPGGSSACQPSSEQKEQEVRVVGGPIATDVCMILYTWVQIRERKNGSVEGGGTGGLAGLAGWRIKPKSPRIQKP